MTTLEIVLLVISLLLLALYVTSKMGKDRSFADVIKEGKEDLTRTAENVSDLVQKATDIVFDENVQKAIKEFIMIVEEKNRLAKDKGEAFLAGDEKKKAVFLRLSEWVSNVTGSTEKAIAFAENNQSKIESIIDDYISASFFRSLIRTCRSDINACSCALGSAADPAPTAPVAPMGAPVVDPAPPPLAPPPPYIRPGDNPAASICATLLA